MYRTVNDFLMDWEKSADGTFKVLESLRDDKLNQAIVEGHSTLGWLGWHLTTSVSFFAKLVGLSVHIPGNPKNVPEKAQKIVEAYKLAAEELKEQCRVKLTDKKLLEEVEGFGAPTPRGAILRTLIDHQTHHRGQMTVLLRQAGLPVPGVMGPTKEEQQK